jgi:hypothetical protein
MEPPAAGALAE